jgi:sugar/nucleoside kinase (ribokinase family)
VDFKMQLHDSDNPDLVSTAQIQTPISRLRGVGLPIPPRVYMLDIDPSEVDIVDFDTRAKDFIDRCISPDRLGDAELPELLEMGTDLHQLWQQDPAAAVGNQPRLSDLFARHRIRNRRFGILFTRLLIRAGERSRAEVVLESYVDRYGTDESFQELEQDLRAPPRPTTADSYDSGVLVVLPGPVAEGDALVEVRERLAASTRKALAQFAISAHNLDLIHTVDRLALDHEARSGAPIEAAGGAAANTAFALARLGHRVGVTGIMVNDRAGSLLCRSLEREGVDLSSVVQLPTSSGERTGRTNIFVDPWGRRSVFIQAGVNDHFALSLREDKARRDRLVDMARNSRIVNISSFTGDAERHLSADLLDELPDDVVVGFDPGYLYTWMGLDRLTSHIRRCDILYIHEQRLRLMVDNSSAVTDTPRREYWFRATLEALFRWRASRSARPLVAVVKRERATGGERSDQIPDEYDMITIAVGRQTIETIVSTHGRGAMDQPILDITGQGDAIAAAVHLGLLSGAPLDECADLAMVFANETNSEIGARTGLPRRSTMASSWGRYFPHTELPVWVPRE